MRGAENPQSPSGVWKWELLRWLGRGCGLSTLIETGTCEGSTPFALQYDFDEIFTIELHNELYLKSLKRLEGIPNVHLYHGDSPTVLRELLTSHVVKNTPLFWLDAHSSGPHTAPGDPVAEEVRVITELCHGAVIVIDDQQNANLKHVTEAGVSLEGWTREYRTGEVLLYRSGWYTIPPFED